MIQSYKTYTHKNNRVVYTKSKQKMKIWSYESLQLFNIYTKLEIKNYPQYV